MVLSRFWLVIFISSIVFIVAGVALSNSYSIDFILNGKKDDPVLIGEKYLNQLPKSLQDSINIAEENTFVVNKIKADVDTTYVYKNQTVQIYSGVQKSDGLLPTCKTTLIDLILPLMAYLVFFC